MGGFSPVISPDDSLGSYPFRFLVHVGRPKTGTSSLQRFFVAEQALLAQSGIHYCRVPRKQNANRWFDQLRPGALPSGGRERAQLIDEIRCALLTEADERALNLVSAESITNMDAALLNDVFLDQDVRYVGYVRNELDFLASSYAQFVHANETAASIDQYIRERGKQHNGLFLDRFDSVLDERFRARIFARGRLDEDNIIVDFLQHFLAQASDSQLVASARKFSDMNPSLSDEVMVFKKMMHQREPEHIERSRVTYSALGSMSSEFGKKFRLPAHLKKELVPFLNTQGDRWGRSYFGETGIFAYDDYGFDESPVPDPLSESRFAELRQAYEEHLSQARKKSPKAKKR